MTAIRRLAALALATLALGARATAPIVIGVDIDEGNLGLSSEQAVKAGAVAAAADLNAAGGVLGRPVRVIVTDNDALPPKGADNMRDLARRPDVAAVIGGKLSAVLLAQVPVASELGVPLVSAWGALDRIVDNGRRPNFVFRMGVNDRGAITRLMQQAAADRVAALGVAMPNNAWGRSALAALEATPAVREGRIRTRVVWFDFHQNDLGAACPRLLAGGESDFLVVANEEDGAAIVACLASRPGPGARVLAHHGVLGPRFVEATAAHRERVRVVAVTSFDLKRARAGAWRETLRRGLLLADAGTVDYESYVAVQGFANAYDAVQLVARAVTAAGSTRGDAVRQALERGVTYDGMLKRYAPAFTASRHEALGAEEYHLVAIGADGALRDVDH